MKNINLIKKFVDEILRPFSNKLFCIQTLLSYLAYFD